MVSKLSLMCLRSICDGVETGQIRGPHLGAYVPPKSTQESPISLRQRLLDLAFIRGSMFNPNCIAAFSSIEFLDEMSSLNIDYYLSEYVQQLAVSLGAFSRINAKVTIGSRIEQLHLFADERNLEPIGHVISNCRNLRVLKLSIVQYGTNENAYQSVRLFSQNRVISDLEELSIDYYPSRRAQSMIGIFLADIRFSKLRAFCIKGKTDPAMIDIEDWTLFLQNVRPTLISLEVENICFSTARDQLFPFSMERLQRLRIGSDHYFEWSPEILAQCGALAHLDVPLDGSIGIDQMRAIQQLNVDLAVNLRLDNRDDNSFVQNQSRFQLVDMFGENVTSVEYIVVETWNEQHMVDVFSACPNLIRFIFIAITPGVIDLSPIFDNDSHRYLKEIHLMGNVKVGKMFEKYVDLESLVLLSTHLIRDQDLIDCTRLGGGQRLARLEIIMCGNLTYNGIVALLIAAGSTLRKFKVYGRPEEETERLREALIKYCPFATFRDG